MIGAVLADVVRRKGAAAGSLEAGVGELRALSVPGFDGPALRWSRLCLA